MRKPCTILGCGREAFSELYCRLHYTRFKATGDPLKTKIRVEGMQDGAPRPVCEVDGCSKQAHAQGLCSLHYQRKQATGDPIKTLKAPKGEGLKYRQSYGRHVPYYIWLWEQHNGRVPEGFHVHHKDGDHSRDVIENLELLAPSGPESHASHHLAERNRKNRMWTRCAVEGCINVKGLSHGYCPTHRQQLETHGRITSVIPLGHSERTRAAWITKREKLLKDHPDDYLKHKRDSSRYNSSEP